MNEPWTTDPERYVAGVRREITAQADPAGEHGPVRLPASRRRLSRLGRALEAAIHQAWRRDQPTPLPAPIEGGRTQEEGS